VLGEKHLVASPPRKEMNLRIHLTEVLLERHWLAGEFLQNSASVHGSNARECLRFPTYKYVIGKRLARIARRIGACPETKGRQDEDTGRSANRPPLYV